MAICFVRRGAAPAECVERALPRTVKFRASRHFMEFNITLLHAQAIRLVVSLSSPWIWTVILLLVLFSKTPSVPVIFSEIKDVRARKLRYLNSPRETLNAGYKKFGDVIWGLDTSQGIKLVLATTYLDELKSHPALSFTASITHDGMKSYTGIGGLPDDVVQIFKAKFNPSIAEFIPYLYHTFERDITSVFPLNREWTETDVYNRVSKLVCVVSTKAFYSDAASRDDEWLSLAPEYIATVLDYLLALKQWPGALRPISRFFIPQRAVIVKQWEKAHAHLSAALRAKKAGVRNDPPSLFDHIVDTKPNVAVDELIHTQMALIVAGIHTTAAGLTQLLFDMAAHPEAKMLREEVEQVFDGEWDKKKLGELKKLDSWMKESQRMTSADLTTFQRQAIHPLRLKSGLSIPKGTKLEIPTASIHFDDKLFPNASSFQPLRYYNMREAEPAKHHYVSTGKTDLSWGYGRHACPGRFFTDVEMKLFIAIFVQKWDVKMKEGQGRHRNFEFEANVMPNVKGTILIKAA